MTRDAAAAAKLIRTDIKTAVKAGKLGDYPAGITFSVRTRRASMMNAVDVTIKGAPREWIYTPVNDTTNRASEAARDLAGKLHDIAASHFETDGQMRFSSVYNEGGLVLA